MPRGVLRGRGGLQVGGASLSRVPEAEAERRVAATDIDQRICHCQAIPNGRL